jgi:type IV pilus biogenesis protein CpaD/CtpE
MALNPIKTILCALFALAIAGCANQSTKQEPSAGSEVSGASAEGAVRARAEARLAALLAGDDEKAYGYLSAATRALMPLDTYKLKRKQETFTLKAAHINQVTCAEADTCTVGVTVTTEILMPTVGRKDYVGTEEESWLKQGDGWFFVPKS